MKSFYTLLFLISISSLAFAQINVVSDAEEFAALRALWENTSGSMWTNNTGWPTTGNWPSSATATQMDDWYGVVVTNGDITQLTLNGNNLKGQLPAQLNKLTKLTHLYVHVNQLSGAIPSELSALTNLQQLYLHSNKFTGTLPSSFSSLTKLIYLIIYSNQISGTLPSIFGGMTQLYGLNIENNQFSGTLPTLRGSVISVSNNRLTGAFPTIQLNSPVVNVNASYNQFTSIPSAVSTWTSLTSLNFSNNELTSLPSSLLTHSNRANMTLNVVQNRFDFSVMNPYATAGFKSTMTMMPQKNVSDIATQTLTIGSALVITARPGATSATWQKQGTTGTWQNLANDQDASVQTYTRSAAAKSDEGVYRWSMTSSSFPNTTLSSDPIQVKTSMGFKLDNWAFQYRYDGRKRMTHKKVPGADWVYMVYDKRDRLVMTQDGEMRKKKQWSYTKYDELNRQIIAGLYTDTTVLTQEGMSAKISDVFFETFDGTPSSFGYTNLVMSSSVFPGTFEPLTITYYDSYQFLSNNTYFNCQSCGESQLVTGLVTGTLTRILGKDRQWIRTVNYYDDKSRLIRSITDDHKQGQQMVTNTYDFVGKVITSQTESTDHGLIWAATHNNIVISEDRIKSNSASGSPYAFSDQSITSNGWVEFTTSSDNGIASTRSFGLSSGTPANITYSVKQTRTIGPASSTIQVFENNTSKGSSININDGDIIRIERTGTTVSYKRNGVVFYTSLTSSSGALRAHAVLTGSGSELYNPRISVNGETRSVERRFDYDHAGRLTKTWHSIDNVPLVLLSKNEYNELGQLIDKKLYSTDSVNFHQSIDYRYNIRGWLTSLNGAELGNGNGKNVDSAHYRKDLFGMDLLYNDKINKIGNDQLYNGNISAMRWSNNLGLGETKERAYKFGYDAMNRLTAAEQKEYKTIDSDWHNASVFHERGVTYDLNGNIKTLLRTDSKGANMDSLTYKYGYNDTRSNMLRRVKDSGTTEGFADGSNYDDDYAYDNNGNLIVDKNKNITSITYNYLNLPEKVTKSTGEYIIYTYDASGRKLVQDVYNSSNAITKRSDYRGEWFMENDTLRFVNHEEGRAVVEGEWVTAPQLLTNPTMNTFVSGAYNGTNGATLSTQTIGSETYMKVTSNNTASTGASTGVAQYVAVKPGMKYTLRVRGYKTSTKPVAIFVNGYGPSVNNAIISPGPDLPNGSSSEGWIQSTFTVPTYFDHINVIMMWRSGVNTGDVFYLNDMELYEYHPGHGNQVFADAGYTYQYHLKDHLGNVRMTFTTKDEKEVAIANFETEKASFLYYEEAVKINSEIFDHTNTGPTYYSTRLNGTPKERFGVAKSLSVMPGDTINMQVFAKYLNPDTTARTAPLNDFIKSIANQTAPAGIFKDGGLLGSTGGVLFPFFSLFSSPPENDNEAPKAYLNWLIFDRDFNLKDGESIQITDEAEEHGEDGGHEELFKQLVVEEAGYVYVYLSNDHYAMSEDEKKIVEVYFDDFKVEHVKSPVVSSQDYYPFGLTFNSYSRENTLNNPYHFNSKELQDELNIGWLDYHARMYQPEIGRWTLQDPHSSSYFNFSMYSYCLNSPNNFRDPNGKDVNLSVTRNKKGEITGVTISSNIYITGEGASEERAEELNDALSSVFKGKKLDNGVNVSFNVKYTYAKSIKTSDLKLGDNILNFVSKSSKESLNERDVSHVNAYEMEAGNPATKRSGRFGQVYQEDWQSNRTVFHESLHFMGLSDRYYQFGSNDPAELSMEGFENDIMGSNSSNIGYDHYMRYYDRAKHLNSGDVMTNRIPIDLDSRGSLISPSKRQIDEQNQEN